jgi:protein-disulfide isomerase
MDKLTKKERKQMKREEKMRKKEKEEKKRLLKRAAIWVISLLVISGAILATIKLASNANRGSQLAAAVAPISKTDHFIGAENSKVILIEYSDFQCPACASYEPLLKKLIKEFNGKFTFVYRNFPLNAIHQNAELAVRAAEAAALQGKFWQMHDLLLQNQKEWAEQNNAKDVFLSYAKIIDLNISEFETDLDSKEIREKVEEDYKNAIRLKLNATPTFFLNGKRIQNPRNYDEFRNVLERAIASNS